MTAQAQLQPKILRASRSDEDYRLYKAALEWDLADPIVIESRKDVKSEGRWRDRVEPFDHQVSNLITFCRRLPVTLLADDVGLGKTISAGLVMSELVARSRLTKTLIVCPKLLGPQWKEELETKFGIPAQVAAGRELLAADPEGVGAVITTYHSARTYLEKLPKDRFEMLILDEAHKLRNLYGVPNPPQVAVKFRKALAERRFRFVLMLTATPIQNRLWDLYSLVDLLTVARGHENPFGNEGLFARKFIAGDREQARQLKPEAAADFRSIVYGYMSRVRRGDARLHFPDRQVQLHRVKPTPQELQLIAIVGKGIEKLNRLAQIGILQALTSSPQALSAQLDNMERNGTIEPAFALAVRGVVRSMTTSAKLLGLGALIAQLKRENPERWRLVIFTSRRETQTTIQAFLEQEGLTVGIINGSSGGRNQDTIRRFRASPPEIRVIVSTEAGSEGVNLQVANVLVNYDLPWNPMIVEQRIGRVQRLASEHAYVGIFNITLQGTFEEYVVGRLMEKLQMSTSAIGDIESLLEGAMGEEGADGFEEKIRQLVVAALKGADVKASVEMARRSIETAKQTLAQEEQQINTMLGSMDGQGYVGPQAPSLPPQTHSLAAQPFALGALRAMGARVSARDGGIYLVEEPTGREYIRFEEAEQPGARSVPYLPGGPAFSRLVQRMVASGVHAVKDLDREPPQTSDQLGRHWVAGFDGTVTDVKSTAARRWFDGTVLVRVRATVAHDSYERLIEVPCAPRDSAANTFSREALMTLPPVLEGAAEALGLEVAQIIEAAQQDPGIAEFTRFYLERREQELKAAGNDARKRNKMEEDFTPRLSFVLAGVEGALMRDVRLQVTYRIGEAGPFTDQLTILPSTAKVTSAPEIATCSVSQRRVPVTCLGTCEVTRQRAMRHLLQASDVSGRLALPQHLVRCELSGQRILNDEAERSAVSGRLVARRLLKTSPMSGRSAEAEHFSRCAFSQDEVLTSELRTSDISHKLFRADAALQSAVSFRTGHRDEFVTCYETRAVIASDEAETCAATGHKVRPGVLERCFETELRVLPSELGRCSISGRRVLKRRLVASSVSGEMLSEGEAVRSAYGKFCAPVETRACIWSGQRAHPDDLRICTLTGIEHHFTHTTTSGAPRLEALVQLLDGVSRTADRADVWDAAAASAAHLLRKGKCRIEAAALSPDQRTLAMVSEVKTFLGLKSRHAGCLYAVDKGQIAGRIAQGKRTPAGWIAESS